MMSKYQLCRLLVLFLPFLIFPNDVSAVRTKFMAGVIKGKDVVVIMHCYRLRGVEGYQNQEAIET